MRARGARALAVKKYMWLWFFTTVKGEPLAANLRILRKLILCFEEWGAGWMCTNVVLVHTLSRAGYSSFTHYCQLNIDNTSQGQI